MKILWTTFLIGAAISCLHRATVHDARQDWWGRETAMHCRVVGWVLLGIIPIIWSVR